MSSQTTSSAVLPSVLADDGGSGGGNDTPTARSDPDRWYFPKERFDTTPSRRGGIDPDKELTYRQQSANFIQDIGQRLQVNQLCINTAIVYMHRFYMFHSFTQFHRNSVSAASIFLAAKVEEQPRKLEHVIKVAHYCLHRDQHPSLDSKSEQYLEQSAELVMNENILLQTLGFDVAIDHPHTHVVKCCQLVRASKDLAQTSYFMATNSLHLTTMCLQYKPTVVACVCIHLACKWSSWEIPRSKEGKDWFWYVDETVTTELLEKLTTDFLQIFNKSPSRLKKKIISLNAASSSSLSLTSGGYHGFDSSPGQPHPSRSRSPSPKRVGNQKPSSSQPGIPSKPKPHGVPLPHRDHGIKPHGHYPPGAPGSTGKHPQHPSHGHLPGHGASGKPPGMPPSKDPHHPHHPQHKNPYPGHGHGSHGQYPHGNRPGIPASGSSHQHHGHAMHSKPVPGPPSTSHPFSSSSGMKNLQPHNPSKPPPHMSSTSVSKMPPNQPPGSVKQPMHPMANSSSQSHMKKPYGNEARPEFGMAKREGSSSNAFQLQNHARHEKMPDGRHHSSTSGLSQSSSTQSSSMESSRNAPHHNLYLGQDGERTGAAPTQKTSYMDSRAMDSSSDMNRHRNMQQSDGKRAVPHGGTATTNGSNSDTMRGPGDTHVPLKTSYRQSGGSTFGQSSQQEPGAKYQPDVFGGEYGSGYGSNSNILTIEDRRKRRHADSIPQTQANTAPTGLSNAKRPRSDANPVVTPLSTSSLFSPDDSTEASRSRLPTLTSQFSPSAMEGPQNTYTKVPADRSQPSGNSYSESIVFGSSETKSDIRRVNPSVEFQAPDLLQPISDVRAESKETFSTAGNVLRTASLFSPEFTPSNSIGGSLNIAPHTDIHKRESYLSVKQEAVETGLSQQSSGFSEGSSQISFTGRLSNSPKRDDSKDEDTHSSKSKKKKKEKHKHKHKEHKKDKHKDKEKDKDKEKEKKDRHRSKEKHSGPVEVSNDLSGHKIKIKLGRDDSKTSTVEPSTRHSSTKISNSSSSSAKMPSNQSSSVALAGLKVKISNKPRIASELETSAHSDGPPSCCHGVGPCGKCNRDSTSQDHYRFYPTAALTVKIAKNKDPSKSFKESTPKVKDPHIKKVKEKASKSSSSGSSSSTFAYSSAPPTLPNIRPPSSSNHYVHKNGVEKSSKKKDKSAS